MDQKDFKAPDDATVARMTVTSISALLEALQGRRARLVKPFDKEIAYYKELLEKKRAERKPRA